MDIKMKIELFPRSILVIAISVALLTGCGDEPVNQTCEKIKNDYQQITCNLKVDILADSNITDADASTALNLFNKDTSKFSDIDYDYYRAEEEEFKDNFTPEQKKESGAASKGRAIHLERISTLSKSYNDIDSVYYHSDELKIVIVSGLNFWIKDDPHSLNWWWRMVGFPKRMSETAMLMKGVLPNELDIRISEYLLYGWDTDGQEKSGANLMDVTNISMQAAALVEDETILTATVSIMDEYFSMMKKYPYPENAEQRSAMAGLQVDNSFTQHTEHGRQLYLAHYGIDYYRAVINFFTATRGTSFYFEEEKESLLESSFLTSIPWIIFEGSFDENQTGRFIGAEQVSSFVDLYSKVIALDTEKKQELNKTLDWISKGNATENHLSGNKAFWRNDYMVQRREGYFTSVRMTSTRTTGNSSGNGLGEKNLHTGDNVNYIMTHGGEYTGLFYENEYWDWNKIPGTTVEQTPSSIPLQKPEWGKYSVGGNPFAGVVSDGGNGASGVIFDNHNITANKSWFFFDNFFVALGQNINATGTSYNISTTLNQVNLNGDMVKFELGSQIGIYHDSIGYLIANSADNAIEHSTMNDIFYLGINHGKLPRSSQYQYLVYPNISEAEFRLDAATSPVKILNNEQYQVVYKPDLSVVYVVSYDSSDITLEDGTTIKTNGPVTLMIKQLGKPEMQVLVSNPTAESLSVLETSFKINGEVFDVKFPEGLYAGQTVEAIKTY